MHTLVCYSDVFCRCSAAVTCCGRPNQDVRIDDHLHDTDFRLLVILSAILLYSRFFYCCCVDLYCYLIYVCRFDQGSWHGRPVCQLLPRLRPSLLVRDQARGRRHRGRLHQRLRFRGEERKTKPSSSALPPPTPPPLFSNQINRGVGGGIVAVYQYTIYYDSLVAMLPYT